MEEEDDEDLLSQRLKESCDTTGKEKNLQKSAEIIHKLAIVYRKRSPDKISLIKCVGLLNAALARNPSNASHIEKDLLEVHNHILQLADAKGETTSFTSKAKNVAVAVTQLRTEVNNFLENTLLKNEIAGRANQEITQKMQESKISSMKQINQIISYQYTSIMADVFEFSQDVMGRPPCEYAVVGMGSLARKEITPYSDFEHILVLEEQEDYLLNLEYFRWLSVISHVIILGLKETIIPSLNIFNLNDSRSTLGNWFYDEQTRGISFDGIMVHACKFPLGRQEKTANKPWITELIKPVGEMLKYLCSEESLKNGYHLSDILTQVCFVFGRRKIYNQFESGVILHLERNTKEQTMQEVKEQTKKDLDQFSARFRLASLKSYDTINIKQLVYRTSTLFIVALGRIHKIFANSSFDVISELAKIGVITENTQHKLLYAVAIACEIRLRVYMKKKSQHDNAVDLRETKNVKKFLDIVGIMTTINYFQISYCLQCEVAKHLGLTKLHFYSNPLLINITICIAFGLEDFRTVLTKRAALETNSTLDGFDFDVCIEELEKGTKFELDFFEKNMIRLQKKYQLFKPVFGRRINVFEIDKKQIESIASYLYSAKVYDEALEFYQYLLTFYENQPGELRGMADTLAAVGLCLNKLDRSAESLDYNKRSLEICQRISQNEEKDKRLALSLNNLGTVLMNTRDFEEALRYLKKALKIYERVSVNADRDSNIAASLNNIGLCLSEIDEYSESLRFSKKALEIYQRISVDELSDEKVAITLHNIGFSLAASKEYHESLPYYHRSLKLYQTISLFEEKDVCIARTYKHIGHSLLGLNNYDESLTWFKKSLKIYQNISLDEEKDINLALIENDIGYSLMKMQLCDKSLVHLKKSLEIFRNNMSAGKKNNFMAYSLKNTGLCSFDMKNYQESLDYLKKSLEIFNSMPSNSKIKDMISLLTDKIKECKKNLD